MTAKLVLIGPPGAGKTRLGKRVSRILATPFVDTDRTVVSAHGPIATIFAEQGEAAFRRYEREAVADALDRDAVVSLGGGAVLDADTQRDLDGLPVVLVTVSPEAVENRIGTKRPLLTGGIESWKALFESRRELYERLATATWDTSSRPIDLIAAEIAVWATEDDA
ncbi:MAG: aroK [Microbacteriaceae bacterium]|nr:aroK [Microbacteriaceae bacterium]